MKSNKHHQQNTGKNKKYIGDTINITNRIRGALLLIPNKTREIKPNSISTKFSNNSYYTIGGE